MQETNEIVETDAIDIQLNGKPTVLRDGTTIAAFLEDRALQDRLVVVELNGKIVARSDFATIAFRNGDQVEVVHFVGGG